jgi:hypothetical protein
LMISQLMVMSASMFTKGTRQWSVPVKPSSLSIAPSATGTPNSWLLARVLFPMPPRRSSTPRSSMRVVVPVEALEDVAVLVADHRVRPVVFQALCGGLHLAPQPGTGLRHRRSQTISSPVEGSPRAAFPETLEEPEFYAAGGDPAFEPQLVATGPARDEQGVPRTVRGRERRWLRWQRMRRRG